MHGLPDALLTRFELVDVLGRGGMATVYRAREATLGELALKVLDPALARAASVRRRFARESALLADLRHPFAVGLLAAGESGGALWLAMELVDGGTLGAWTDTWGPMPPRLAVHAALEVGQSLVHAHDRGVIHRDVKPGNVLVGSDGRCRLADFGVARLLDDTDPSVTRTGTALGTFGFMAPEQRLDARSADARADVYALAATVLALVTGRVPRLLDHELAQSGLPQDLAWVLGRATLADPAHRHPDMRALVRALDRASAELPPVPRGTPPLHLPLPPPPAEAPTQVPSEAP